MVSLILLIIVTLIAFIAEAETCLAQNFERYRPLQPVVPLPSAPSLQETLDPVAGSDKTLLESLEAVIVVDNADKVLVDGAGSDATGLVILFDRRRSLVHTSSFRNIIDGYLNQPVSLRSLNQMSRDIILLYRRNGQPVVDVLIPEQKISNGTVQIVIVESQVSRVLIQHGRFFNADDLTPWVESTRRGGMIYEPWVEDDLFWLSQSPFRQHGIDLRPGLADGTTDVIYTTEDVFPLRGYVGFDDTGVQALGLTRYNAGFIVGNVFSANDTASYQYTTDADFRKLHAHAASYTNHLNRDYSFQAYGSWAGVDPSILGGFGQQGESWQAGFEVIRNLEKNRYIDENISVGFDFKATNNNLEFGGINVQNSEAELAHLRIGYNYLERNNNDEYMRLAVNAFLSPGRGFSGQNTAAAFSTIRPNTAPQYAYLRAHYDEAVYVGENWLFEFRGTAQASSERLLFSEMLGFGGYDTIRGFDQRTANGDHGWLTSFEFGPRPNSFYIRGQEGRFRLYAFIDAGQAIFAEPLPGENANQTMVSGGVGARISLAQNLSARIDFGHGFNSVPFFDRSSRLHLGLIWQFGPLASNR